jgi:Mrp family chromosome partitioning ATPase
VPPNPAELLNTSRITQLCEHLQTQFDLIIFDCAIALSIADTLIIASSVGGLCLVHDPNRGDKGGVETAKKMLERANANILGIMFNNVRLKTSTYGDYHYYSSEYTVNQYKRIE